MLCHQANDLGCNRGSYPAETQRALVYSPYMNIWKENKLSRAKRGEKFLTCSLNNGEILMGRSVFENLDLDWTEIP